MLDTFSNATAAIFSNLENDLLESTTNEKFKKKKKNDGYQEFSLQFNTSLLFWIASKNAEIFNCVLFIIVG